MVKPKVSSCEIHVNAIAVDSDKPTKPQYHDLLHNGLSSWRSWTVSPFLFGASYISVTMFVTAFEWIFCNYDTKKESLIICERYKTV